MQDQPHGGARERRLRETALFTKSARPIGGDGAFVMREHGQAHAVEIEMIPRVVKCKPKRARPVAFATFRFISNPDADFRRAVHHVNVFEDHESNDVWFKESPDGENHLRVRAPKFIEPSLEREPIRRTIGKIKARRLDIIHPDE
jgi:hypothetical protein